MGPRTGSRSVVLVTAVVVAAACSSGGADSTAPTSTIVVPEVLAAAIDATIGADDVVIGAVLDLSSPRSEADIAVGVAVEHEVSRIAAAGGIADRRLVLSVVDSLGTVLEAARAADELVDHRAIAIVVGCDSDQAAAAAAVAEARGVLVVAPCALADALGAARPDSLTFQLATPASIQGRALAEHAATSGVSTAVTIAEVADAASLATCGAFVARFTELGGLVQAAVEISEGELPANQVGETLARFTPPGIVVSCVAPPAAATVLLDLRLDGSGQPVLSSSPGDVDDLVGATPGDAAALGPPLAPFTPEQQALVAERQVRGASDLSGIAAVEVIRAAIDSAAGASDGASLAAALEAGVPITTVIGVFMFSDSDHSGAAARPVVLRGHLADGTPYVFERLSG